MYTHEVTTIDGTPFHVIELTAKYVYEHIHRELARPVLDTYTIIATPKLWSIYVNNSRMPPISQACMDTLQDGNEYILPNDGDAWQALARWVYNRMRRGPPTLNTQHPTASTPCTCDFSAGNWGCTCGAFAREQERKGAKAR